MLLWVSKVLALILMLVVTLVSGLVPVKMLHWIDSKRAVGKGRVHFDQLMSLLNCMAGGVFLGTTLLHLLPEVREQTLAALTSLGIVTDFAVAEFMVGVGFFIVMFLEHLVMVLQHHHGEVPLQTSGDVSDCSSECSSDSDEEANLIPSSKKEVHPTSVTNKMYGSLKKETDDFDFTEDLKHSSMQLIDRMSKNYKPQSKPVSGKYGFSRSLDSQERQRLLEHYDQMADVNQAKSRRKHNHCSDTVVFCKYPHHHHHHHHKHKHTSGIESVLKPIFSEEGACIHVITPTHHEHHHVEVGQLGGIRSFVLLLAMSLHTVFEGLALGLQTTTTDVWGLFIAVIIHKVLISFSLGLQFAESLKHPRRAALFVILFALMSPVGVVIGIIVTIGGQTSSSIVASEAVLQALAAGTFIYVAFFEVLMKEVGQDHGLLKVSAIVLGFGIMTIFNLFL